jgi:predicted O-linked N-acetylglucosamine transferase (SPINDLY family)
MAPLAIATAPDHRQWIMLDPEHLNRLFREQAYSEIADLCKQAIASDPHQLDSYWYLGIQELLAGEESQAQAIWWEGLTLSGFSDAASAQLQQIIAQQAQQELQADRLENAWLLRYHLQDLCPDDMDNLLQMLTLGVKLQVYDEERYQQLNVVQQLQTHQQTATIPPTTIFQLIDNFSLCFPLVPFLPELVKNCTPYLLKNIQSEEQVMHLINYIRTILIACTNITFRASFHREALEILLYMRQIAPNDVELLIRLAETYVNLQDYETGIATFKLALANAKDLLEKVLCTHLLLKAVCGSGSRFAESQELLVQQEKYITELLASTVPWEEQIRLPDWMEDEERVREQTIWNQRTFVCYSLAPYLSDDPQRTRHYQNLVGEFCSRNHNLYGRELREKFQARHTQRTKTPQRLKIGYLSHCLRSHSVGWLCRWLFAYHDRSKFEIYGYFIAAQIHPDPVQQWFLDHVDKAYTGDKNGVAPASRMAEQIYNDGIDILVDLDSITLDGICDILLYRPAPIQATWLGWDASGLPSVDYFIADPYVLPESAQEYYRETIWRLPRTYIAVDGFELAVPSLRRDELGIPADAVVYFSGQKGYKRHPDTLKLQMQILANVPHSYLLLKGIADEAGLRESVLELAEKEGVAEERIKFLAGVPTEAQHRANMTIADVVLDTYPYNGATTTLEALWMGLPLVTRVGQQFFARYSYTMLVNAGITEGIAWSAEEYVEWGVRLGHDAALRQAISWKLKQSRHTAPLWNARAFTRDMEAAYWQMWQRFTAT